MKKFLCLLLCCLTVAASAEEADTYYYNPDGGMLYHADANCRRVGKKYLPLTPFDASLLTEPPYDALRPCSVCLPDKAASPASCDLSTPAPTREPKRLSTAEEARLCAEAFLASPYTAAFADSCTLTVTQAAEGWQVTVSDAGSIVSLLLFDAQGRLVQFDSLAYPAPALAPASRDTAMSLEETRILDDLRGALFPHVDFHTGAIYVQDEASGVTWLMLDDSAVWVGLRDGTVLIGMGDLSLGARYPDCLTRGEAEALALAAVQEEKQLQGTISAARFLREEQDGRTALRWEVTVSQYPDGQGEEYAILLDAVTGEIISVTKCVSNG